MGILYIIIMSNEKKINKRGEIPEWVDNATLSFNDAVSKIETFI